MWRTTGNCDDGVGCTVDVCDATNDCSNTTDDSLCDDGVNCTTDSCDAVNDCQNTTDDGVCDDGVACTVDVCDPVTDCNSSTDDSFCDDGIACSTEFCDAIDGCVVTADNTVCDDGEACTLDACSIQAGGCIHEESLVYNVFKEDLTGWTIVDLEKTNLDFAVSEPQIPTEVVGWNVWNKINGSAEVELLDGALGTPNRGEAPSNIDAQPGDPIFDAYEGVEHSYAQTPIDTSAGGTFRFNTYGPYRRWRIR